MFLTNSSESCVTRLHVMNSKQWRDVVMHSLQFSWASKANPKSRRQKQPQCQAFAGNAIKALDAPLANIAQSMREIRACSGDNGEISKTRWTLLSERCLEQWKTSAAPAHVTEFTLPLLAEFLETRQAEAKLVCAYEAGFSCWQKLSPTIGETYLW